MEPTPTPDARVIGTEEQAREYVHGMAAATWDEQVPNQLQVAVAMAVLVVSLEQRCSELERRVQSLESRGERLG